MFCSNCGKQIEDGVRFCKYCGTPTSHPETPAPRPAEELGTKQEERSVQAAPVTAAESSPKSKRKRDFVLPAVLIAAVVIATGGLLVRSMSGNGGDSAAVGSSGDIDNTETIGSDIANNSYAIPELPDALYIAVSTPSPGNDIGYYSSVLGIPVGKGRDCCSGNRQWWRGPDLSGRHADRRDPRFSGLFLLEWLRREDCLRDFR